MNTANLHFGPMGAAGDAFTAQTGMFDKALPEDAFEKNTDVAAFNEAMAAIMPGAGTLQNGGQYPVGNMNRDNK